MKTVFNDPIEVAHLWAHQKQDCASYRSMHFSADTVYSYNTPIAKILKHNNKTVYVINTYSYSRTTDRHITAVLQSIPYNAITFEDTISNRFDGDYMCYWKNVDFIIRRLSDIVSFLQKQSKARLFDYRKDILHSISQIAQWITFWELDRRRRWTSGCVKYKYYPSIFDFWKENNIDKVSKCVSEAPVLDATTFVLLFSTIHKHGWFTNVPIDEKCIDILLNEYYGAEYISRINANNKKLETLSKRRRTISRKKTLKNALDSLESWHNGELKNWYHCDYFVQLNGWDTALRVVGKCYIETSKHVQLSLDEGWRLWQLVKAFEQGKQFQHDLVLDLDGQRWKLDKYENHILFAGCHAIPFSECERIAKQMNWQ